MKKITSHENKIYKMCLQLESRKYREKLGRYIIEGPNLIEEALKNNIVPDFLILDETAGRRAEITGLCERYAAELGKAGEENILIFEEQLFASCAKTENSQGVMGIVQKNSVTEDSFFEAERQGNGNILVLDRLQDPGNAGTMIRTADAAGYAGIIILKGTVDIFSPKVVRACTGSLFRMPLLFSDSPEQTIQLLKKHGKRVVSTGFETDKYYYETDLKNHIGLVIGNEGNGICEVFKEHSDEVVKIPMSGSIESLNASVAAAILMYEAMRHG